jgi:hypothetical protein
VPFDLVRAGRLLDEPRLGEGKVPHPVDCLVDFPDMVGVDHLPVVGADRPPRDRQPAAVVGAVAPDLHLDVPELRMHRFPATPGELLAAIAEPARGCRVAGIAFPLERGDPPRLAGLPSS